MSIPFVISIISLSLCIAGFFFLRWYISRRTAASQVLEEYREEVDRLIAGIHAATDKNLLLMEDKIKILKKLMEDTDKRISVYMREIQRSRTSEAVYKNLGKGIREALESHPAESASSEALTSAEESSTLETASSVKTHVPAKKNSSSRKSSSSKMAPAEETIELPFSDEEKGLHAGSVKKTKRRKAEKTQSSARPEKPRIKMQIAQMAIQGLSPHEIATELGVSLAEVDLALQLLNLPGKGD
jgi:DNA-binding NarL/FixJ family response regulator